MRLLLILTLISIIEWKEVLTSGVNDNLVNEIDHDQKRWSHKIVLEWWETMASKKPIKCVTTGKDYFKL